MASCPLDCSNRTHIPSVDLEANGDIAGPGVIIGFVGNAYFALLLLMLYYLVSFDPLAHPFGSHDGNDEEAIRRASWWKPSPVDSWFLGLVRGRTRRLFEKPVFRRLGLDYFLLHDAGQLEPRFISSIMHMCDLQLLTGFAILISAYIEVPCSMSAYHWQIVVYLAWFSSITHLTGLISARHYLYNRPWSRFFRIFLSLAFLVMLLTAMIPTAYFNWSAHERQISTTEMSSSVACFYDPTLGPDVWHAKGVETWEKCMGYVDEQKEIWRDEVDGLDEMIDNGTVLGSGEIPPPDALMLMDPEKYCEPLEPTSMVVSVAFQAVLFSVILLCWGFLSRFIKLWMPLERFLAVRIRRPIASKIQDFLVRIDGTSPPKSSTSGRGALGPFHFFVKRPIAAWLVFIRLNVDCLASMFGEVYWLTIILIWGTLRLNATTNFARKSGEVDGEQDWNFGQTLPVLLLIGPFIMVVRSFTTTRVKQDPRQAWQQQQDGEESQSDSLLSRQTTLLPDSHRNPAWGNTMRITNDLTADRRERDQYKRSTWMGACLFSVFFTFSFEVGMTFASLMDLQGDLTGTGSSIAAVWISQYQLIVHLLFYYPIAMHVSILFGLLHDDLCKKGVLTFKNDGAGDIKSNGGGAEKEALDETPTCGHGKLLVPMTLIITIMFTAMFCLSQFTDWDLGELDESVNLVVLGFTLAGLLYILYAIVALCCRRRREKET